MNANIARARTTGGVSLQAGYAAVAAFTAASTSAAVDIGVRAMTTPFAGLWTSSRPAPDEATHRPATKFCRTSGMAEL